MMSLRNFACACRAVPSEKGMVLISSTPDRSVTNIFIYASGIIPTQTGIKYVRSIFLYSSAIFNRLIIKNIQMTPESVVKQYQKKLKREKEREGGV
jgi:hypothetical protein